MSRLVIYSDEDDENFLRVTEKNNIDSYKVIKVLKHRILIII